MIAARIALFLIGVLISFAATAACTVKNMAALLNDFSSCSSRGLPEGCITPQNIQDLICSIPTIAGPATTSVDGTYTCPTVTVTNGIPDFVSGSCVLQNIAGIALSNASVIGGQPSGTTVGNITVGMAPSTPPFAGGLGLSGTGASSFQIVAGSLKTNGVVTAGAYDINIIATQSTGVANSPFTQAAAIAVQDISSVALSNNQIVGGQPSGTMVGVISVVMSPSSPGFSGSFSLTGASASSFQISGSNLLTNGVVANGTYNFNIVATQAGGTRTQAVTVTAAAQTIASVILSNDKFISGTGSANTTIGNIYVVMSPETPAFNGTLSLSGTNASSFALSGTQFKIGGSDLGAASYAVNVVATKAGAIGSPKTQAQTIVGAPTIWVNDQTQPMPYVCVKQIWVNPSASASGGLGGGKTFANGGIGTAAAPFALATDLYSSQIAITPGTCVNIVNSATLNDSAIFGNGSGINHPLNLVGTFSNAPDGYWVIRSTDNTGALVQSAAIGGGITSTAATWLSSSISANNIGNLNIQPPTDYVIVDGINFVMDGVGRMQLGLPCIQVGSNPGNNIQGGLTHFQAHNNSVTGCGNGGFNVGGSDYVSIQNNVIKSIAVSAPQGVQESGISIASSAFAPGYTPSGYDSQLCTTLNGSCLHLHQMITGNKISDPLILTLPGETDGNCIIIDTNVMSAPLNAGAYLYGVLIANNVMWHCGAAGIQGFNSQHIYAVNNTIIHAYFDGKNNATGRSGILFNNVADNVVANNASYNIGADTTVRTTGTGTVLAVDNVLGFLYSGAVQPPSPSFPIEVTVDGVAAGIVGRTIDSTNVSTSPGGLSGTLTFATAIASPHGNAGVSIVALNPTNNNSYRNSPLIWSGPILQFGGGTLTTCLNWAQPPPCAPADQYQILFNQSSAFWYNNIAQVVRNSNLPNTTTGPELCISCAQPPTPGPPGNNLLWSDPLFTTTFFSVSPNFEMSSVSLNNTGAGCVRGEIITLAGGSPVGGDAATIQADGVSGGQILSYHLRHTGTYPANTTTNFTQGSTTGSCTGTTFSNANFLQTFKSTSEPNIILQGGSPALATGSPNYLLSRNYFGTARSSPPNIGAY